jgi:hypothetical protein
MTTKGLIEVQLTLHDGKQIYAEAVPMKNCDAGYACKLQLPSGRVVEKNFYGTASEAGAALSNWAANSRNEARTESRGVRIGTYDAGLSVAEGADAPSFRLRPVRTGV